MDMDWKTWLDALDQTFLGISLGRFAAAFGIMVLALIVKRVVRHLFLTIFPRLAQRSQTVTDDLFFQLSRRPAELLVFVAGLKLAVSVLQLPKEPIDLQHFADNLLIVLLTLAVAWFLFNLVTILEHALRHFAQQTDSLLDDNLLPFIRKSLRAFILLMAGLMLFQNLGYSISGILASLGIGGLAIALAAKDTLSNVFGSFMILVDRPFHLGDWIKAGDLEGVVEEVGFRSTKIRTFAKTLITVPNSVLCNLAINNFSRMPKRRIKLTVGVTYDTTTEQMKQAVESIRHMLQEHPAIQQDFWLVNFNEFGASSLDIMVYCFTHTTVWADYLDARQDVCLKIMEILEQQGLEIAFPSRTIYLKEDELAPPEPVFNQRAGETQPG